MVKILNVLYDDIPNPWLGGGGAIRALEIYKRFPSDYQVTILTGYYPNALRRETIQNVQYRRLGLPWSYALSRITFALSVPFHLLQNDYDIIIDDHSAFSPTFSFFYTKKPVIGSFQNLHSQKSAKGKGACKGFFAEIFDFIALRNFKHYTAVSPNLVSIIQKKAKHKKNIKFIGVGVHDSFFELKKPEKLENGYLLFIGRIEIYQKGIDTLLKAYSKIKNPPKLIIAGNGIDFEEVKRIVADQGIYGVEFFGRYTMQQEIELLKNAICAIMPSRFEGFPMVPLEILASGTPFIGTSIPGTKDLVQENGLLVEKENSEQLSHAIEKLLMDKALRNRLSLQGRSHAKNFTWDLISKEWLQNINEVLSKEQRS